MSGRAQKVLDGALDLTDEDRSEVAPELERRARWVLADPGGGEDWSAARAEIESKLRRP